MIDYYKKIIKEKMSQKRYNHSVSVSSYAVKLAKKYGADEKKAELAGILHDITKEMKYEDQIKLFEKNGIKLSNIEINSKKLWHANSGFLYVKDKLNIKDKEILNAIKYHTTAKDNMTLLEKIIFIADFISDDRKFDDIEVLRDLAFKNLDDAIVFGLKFTIKDLIGNNILIAENTLKAYNELMLKKY